MRHHHSIEGSTLSPGASLQTVDTRLRGSWLLIARVAWVTLVVLSVGVFITAVLVYYLVLHGTPVPGHLLRATSAINGYVALIFRYTPLVDDYFAFNTALLNVLALVWVAVGLVIFWQRSDDRVALFASLALILMGTSFSPVTYLLVIVFGPTSPGGVLITGLEVVAWSSIGLSLVLFPDGRFVPRWTRWLVLGYLVSQVPLILPANSSFTLGQWPSLLLAVPIIVAEVVLLFAQVYRYRRVSSAVQRQQTKWVLFALLVAIPIDVANVLPTLVFPTFRQPGPWHTLYIVFSEVTLPAIVLLIPLAIGFAILRYRLWEVDLLLNRTLVYGLLTACSIGLYLLVVVGLGTLLSAGGNLFFSLLATAIIAALFHPLRERLQRVVNRLMFGERDDPYRVLLRLGQRLEHTLAPEKVLPAIVETLAQALKLPYAAIAWQQDAAAAESSIVAAFGNRKASERCLHIPLIYQQEVVGALILAPRSPGESLDAADQRLLHDLARQVSVAVHAVRLTADLHRLTLDLQRSRERLVLTREEERRRLRRDLHDGLGPRLASLTLKLETARNRLSHDPLADTLLSDLITRTQEAVADVRRLVNALRPPALDELGLLPALHEQILQYSDLGDHALHISLEVPTDLPPLPAALEVALFRIAQEALTNVVRHAQASWCVVSLALCEREQALELTISDNGRGLPPIRGTGVGLASMRERAEELGGTWVIESLSTGGTGVRVRLPCSLPILAAAPSPEPDLTVSGEEA
ncbi:MAG TPA: GAF domain-containing sensor histidine kinase [Ktedonobacterales bacterium]|nr:GAF domain-containing sensor histidine kinase [Ktedonobacterales bacterium]